MVYVDHASWLQTLSVHARAPGGARSPVTSADGLVGRVILTEGSYAKVQLVTDRASGVGAMIERTRRQGIVRGAGRDGLTLEYVPLQADVQVGDRVVTSGTDGLYPRGVPIGTVVSVEPGGELFHSVQLAPAVDFGQLDQVFLLLADSLPGRLKGRRVRVLRFVAALVAALLVHLVLVALVPPSAASSIPSCWRSLYRP